MMVYSFSARGHKVRNYDIARVGMMTSFHGQIVEVTEDSIITQWPQKERVTHKKELQVTAKELAKWRVK